VKTAVSNLFNDVSRTICVTTMWLWIYFTTSNCFIYTPVLVYLFIIVYYLLNFCLVYCYCFITKSFHNNNILTYNSLNLLNWHSMLMQPQQLFKTWLEKMQYTVSTRNITESTRSVKSCLLTGQLFHTKSLTYLLIWILFILGVKLHDWQPIWFKSKLRNVYISPSVPECLFRFSWNYECIKPYRGSARWGEVVEYSPPHDFCYSPPTLKRHGGGVQLLPPPLPIWGR